MNALDGMERHVRALFVHDARGRLVATNEWQPRPAPRVFFGRTRDGALWRFGEGLPETLVAALESVLRAEPGDEPAREPRGREEILRLLSTHRPVERVWSGPAYCFARAPEPLGETKLLAPGDAGSLPDALGPWRADVPHLQPFCVALAGAIPAAVCASVRITREAHEAGVETDPAQRRRGHALTAVSGWARAVFARGATPLYSTSWDNLASQAVATRLGLVRFGVDFHAS